MRYGRDSHHTDAEITPVEDRPTAFAARLIELAADTMPVGILLIDPDSDVVLYTNRRFLELWGIEHLGEELRRGSLSVPRLIEECVRRMGMLPHLRQACLRLCGAGREGFAEEEFPLPDGRCLRGCSVPLSDSTGVLVGQALSFTDVTARKRAEMLLHLQRDLAVALASAANVDTVLDLALDAVLQIEGLDSGGIYLVDAATGALELAAHRGLSARFVEAATHYDAGSPNACLVRDGRSVYASHQAIRAQLGLDADDAQTEDGVRALAVVPVPHEGEVIAALNAGSHTRDEVPEDARSALEAIAGQIGGAIARTRAEAALRRSERELRISEERMHLGLEGSDVGLWDWDLPTGQVVFVRHWAEILGYPPEEIEDHIRMWERHIHPEDKSWVTQALEEHFEGRTPLYETVHRLRAWSGEWRWVLDRGKVTSRDAEGRPLRAVGMHLDVTRLKHVEEELRRREEAERVLRQHLVVLQQIGEELLYAEDVDALCRRAVELGRERLGFERLGIWFRDPDPDYALGSFGIDEEGEVRDERGRRVHVIPGSPLARIFAGKERFLLCEDAVLRDDRGEEIGRGARLLAAIWDGREVLGAVVADSLFSRVPFTEEQGEVLAHYASLLGHLRSRTRMEEMRRKAEELAEVSRQKDEFVAMLAHELRNPAAAIVNAVHLARSREGEGTERTLDILGHQAQHISRLLEDILDLSRANMGKVELRQQTVDLGMAVADAVETVRGRLVERRHTLDLLLPEEPIQVTADPTRLAQILWNLLSNAARYTPSGGRIRVAVSCEAGEAVVRVADNGLGISPEDLPRIFEPFVQGERAGSGLGIGLALVRCMVEMHGGRVEAHSEGECRGSEFVVRLPLPGSEPLVRTTEPQTGTGPRAPSPGRRILVVDDNQEAAEVLADLLGIWGHQVATAHDGHSALDVAGAFGPDVALLDLNLPGLDGWEVARRLRQMPDASGVLLVAMTGYGGEHERLRATEAGFDRYLTKPVDPSVLWGLLGGEDG